MSCYHIVPSITATMEEMPERHTYVKHPVPSITATMEEMPERQASSSIHFCHNGGDARKAHVKLW